MPKLWIILGIILIVAVAAVFALPYLIDVNRYHDRIEAELQRRTGRTVSLGPMRLSIVPFAIRAQSATIGEDASFGQGKVFAHADEVYVRADLLPLLSGNVQLRSLEMVRPQIELVRNAGGVWNFASLGQNPATAQLPQGTTPEEQARAQQQRGQQKSQEFALDRLRITDGQVAVTDYQKRQPRSIYDHIDLAVENYRPGEPFLVDLAAHLPGTGKQTARLNATVGPIDEKNSMATPVDGTLNLEEVSVAAVQRFLNTAALANTDGVASGKASVKSRDGKLESQGSLQLEQAKIR
ncbi:MAG TPA: AsmA family protein, partial [Terriglobales bacterium]|nr:AsmA family protein [Terriglobales bacterium]